MKKILITGADSYIGTSVEKWLGRPEFSGMYQVDTVDMRGDGWKEKDFSGYDAVFHVAGIAHADIRKVTEEQKRLYYAVNCDLAVETARKAKTEGVKQFIYMSSIIVYGEGTSVRKKRVITRIRNRRLLISMETVSGKQSRGYRRFPMKTFMWRSFVRR